MANFTCFTTFPIFCHREGAEPIWPVLQLFQTFPIEVAQNDLEWPILPILQLFQSFPTKLAQNDSEWPISLFLNFSKLFPLKRCRMISQCLFMMDLGYYRRNSMLIKISNGTPTRHQHFRFCCFCCCWKI